MLTDEADAPWVDDANRYAMALLQRARETGWRARFALDDHRGGLALAERTLAVDPLNEDAHRAVMFAHHQLGEPGKALAAYERLREMLAEEFGADPSAESEDLYLNVLRGEHGDEPPGSARPTAAQRQTAPGTAAPRHTTRFTVNSTQNLDADALIRRPVLRCVNDVRQ